MNRYFSSFQKSRGDDPPRKFRGGGGGHVPRPPRDRRLCAGVPLKLTFSQKNPKHGQGMVLPKNP